MIAYKDELLNWEESYLFQFYYPPSAALDVARKLGNGSDMRFDEMSELLLNWATAVIIGYKE